MGNGIRNTIANRQNGNISKRALQGKLTVYEQTCKYCGHHKCFENRSFVVKCCKCKQEQ